MASKETFCLEVIGDYACFTRPEMKVERVSYDVITPSAARGIFEAILWKPALRWQVAKIEVLRPIQWVNIRRNEVSSIASNRKPQIWVEDDRQQRAGLFLRDVSYRLHAKFSLRDDSGHIHNFPELQSEDGEKNGNENSYPKFAEMFKRRADKGQCFNQPYLGTREFSADFRLIEDTHLATEQRKKPAIDESRNLGWMLYDMDYDDLKNPKPRFFNAAMEKGVIEVPSIDSDKVRG